MNQKIIYFILCLITIYSCKTKEQKIKSEQITFFSKRDFNFLNEDTIFIYTRFSECGEWGGHEEELKLFLRDTNFMINYIKNKAICDEITEIGYIPKKTIKDTSFYINDFHKKALYKYYHHLLDSKIQEEFPGNTGVIRAFGNKKKQLYIWIYGSSPEDEKEYFDLISKLGLKY